MWIDFEEGDEIEVGTRLLQMGVSPTVLVDKDLFRFSTPEDVEARHATRSTMQRCVDATWSWPCTACVMYGLFGWEPV